MRAAPRECYLPTKAKTKSARKLTGILTPFFGNCPDKLGGARPLKGRVDLVFRETRIVSRVLYAANHGTRSPDQPAPYSHQLPPKSSLNSTRVSRLFPSPPQRAPLQWTESHTVERTSPDAPEAQRSWVRGWFEVWSCPAPVYLTLPAIR